MSMSPSRWVIRPATAFSPSGDFLYQPDDPRFKEVMVYYHIDAAERYIQSLGYSDDNQPPTGAFAIG